MLRELEEEARHDGARLIRQAEGEARHEAERRARSILSTCIQRVAAGHVVESTVSVVELRSDELKGRIIGREGRNIRALETIRASTSSSTTPPARCCSRASTGCAVRWSALTFGRLQFRTSYGQNVLAHSVECARLAGLLAGELRANARTASRAALLHDMGKAGLA